MSWIVLSTLLATLPTSARSAGISNNTFWVFVGDSTVRFQYLTLAYYARTGAWHVPSGGGVNLTDGNDVETYAHSIGKSYHEQLPHHPLSAGCNTSGGRSRLASKWQARVRRGKHSGCKSIISLNHIFLPAGQFPLHDIRAPGCV